MLIKNSEVIVNNALKQNPNAFVAAVGLAQLQPDKLAEINGVDLVLG